MAPPCGDFSRARRAKDDAKTLDASDISHDERDAMVRAALAEQGDSGVTPRHTLFYFYGEGDHGDLNEVARRAGFLTRGGDDMTVLETTMAVDEASFAATSAMMQTWAAAFQLDYDGWECAVVTH